MTNFSLGFDTHALCHRNVSGADYPTQAATMAEAQKRWRQHTRACLSDEGIAAAKRQLQWLPDAVNGPLLILGDGRNVFYFRFRVVSRTGNCFAQSV